MHRRRQHRPDNIGKERKRRHTRETLGAIRAARAVAGIVLRAGIVLVMTGYCYRIIKLGRMACMHARYIRRRCGCHRQSLYHRRAGKCQRQDQGKRDAWQGHTYDSNIGLSGRQTVFFGRHLPRTIVPLLQACIH